jgi:FG-GAP-like repeat
MDAFATAPTGSSDGELKGIFSSSKSQILTLYLGTRWKLFGRHPPQQPLNYDTGGYYPIQIAISDVDLNGWPDILVVNYLGTMNRIAGSVGVLLNGSQDSFFLEMVSPGGHSAWAVAEGDLNGDGGPDLVIVIDGNLVVDFAGGEVRNRGIYAGAKAVAIADVNAMASPTWWQPPFV